MDDNKRQEEMSSELISKRELLELYGVSYGTLYRWKRMGLIPEEWLVKKSTFTGQETFFNRELICQRFEEILSQKDTISLEKLSQSFSKRTEEIPKLRISTAHGDKVYYLTDIKDITVEMNGKTVSVVAQIKSAIDEN